MIKQKRLIQHRKMCFNKLQQKHKCYVTEVLGKKQQGNILVLIGTKMAD